MKTNKQKFIGFSLLAVFALVLSACGGSSKEPTPTPLDPNLIAAQAIATFAMGLTQTAFAQPTVTLTLTPAPTSTLAATFAPLGTNTGAAPVNTCDVSVFTFIETIPDGTPMAPGQNFDKSWRLQNSGTCNWDSSYRLKWVGGSPLGAAEEQLLYPARAGTQAMLSIHFIAPAEAGFFESAWQAVDPNGNIFGELIFIKIVVSP